MAPFKATVNIILLIAARLGKPTNNNALPIEIAPTILFMQYISFEVSLNATVNTECVF